MAEARTGIDFRAALAEASAMGGAPAATVNAPPVDTGSPIDFGDALNQARAMGADPAERGWSMPHIPRIPRPHMPSIPRPDAGRLIDALINNRAALLVRSGLKDWADNVNPLKLKEKDRYWWTGAVLGGATTVIANEFALGPVAPVLRAAVTTAISVGAPLAFKRLYSVDEQRRTIEASALTPEQKLEQIEAAEQKYKLACTRIRNGLLGFSAGATYGGLLNLAGHVTGLDQQVHDLFSKTADSSSANVAQKVVQKAASDGGAGVPPSPDGAALPGPVAETITLQSGSNPTEAVTKFLVDHGVKPTPENVHEAVTKFMDQNGIVDAHKVAANVAFKAEGLVASAVSLPDNIAGLGIDELAKNVDLQHVVTNIINSETVTPDKLVNEAVNQMNLHSGGVPESIYRGTQQAISEKLHEVFNQAVVDSHATTADAALAAGKKAIEAQITDPAMHSNIIDFTQKALETGIQENANMFHEVLTNSSSNMTEVVIPAGSNVSTILEQSGHHINWTPDNAELFGSEIAVNFDTLTNYWGLMDKAGYLPAGAHFPATMSELYQIIEKAKSGDVGAIAAMDNLKRMLRYVPAGMKLRVLNEAGVGSVVGALKALAKAS